MPRFHQAVVSQTHAPLPPLWTPRQDRYLQAWWGLRPDAEVAAALGRTVAACTLRAKRHLKIARTSNFYTGRRVGAIFGVDPTTAYRNWRRRGWLHPYKSTVGAGGHTTAWAFGEADLARFVRERPWAYDPARMEPGHWLTDLASEVSAADPWLTLEEAGRLACVVPGTVADWCYKGWLPSRRRPNYGRTAGPHGGRYVVRRSDLLAFVAASPDRERRRRTAGAKRGRALRRPERAA